MSSESLNNTIDSREALVEAICRQIEETRYHLDIFSRDLSRDVFGDEKVVALLKTWVVGQPRARVRIFVQKSQASMFRGNALIELGLQLTSYFSFREPSPQQLCELHETVISDNRLAVVWSSAAILNALSITQPAEVALKKEAFDACWSQGQPSRQIRNLYL